MFQVGAILLIYISSSPESSKLLLTILMIKTFLIHFALWLNTYVFIIIKPDKSHKLILILLFAMHSNVFYFVLLN